MNFFCIVVVNTHYCFYSKLSVPQQWSRCLCSLHTKELAVWLWNGLATMCEVLFLHTFTVLKRLFKNRLIDNIVSNHKQRIILRLCKRKTLWRVTTSLAYTSPYQTFSHSSANHVNIFVVVDIYRPVKKYSTLFWFLFFYIFVNLRWLDHETDINIRQGRFKYYWLV